MRKVIASLMLALMLVTIGATTAYAAPAEDSPEWQCNNDGNGICGPITVYWFVNTGRVYAFESNGEAIDHDTAVTYDDGAMALLDSAGNTIAVAAPNNVHRYGIHWIHAGHSATGAHHAMVYRAVKRHKAPIVKTMATPIGPQS